MKIWQMGTFFNPSQRVHLKGCRMDAELALVDLEGGVPPTRISPIAQKFSILMQSFWKIWQNRMLPPPP